jgi:hypothetical protein
MKAPRLAAGFGLAGWFVGGLMGYFFEGGPGLGLVSGLLAAILGAELGGTSDVLTAVNGRGPRTLPTPLPSDPDL